MVLTPVVQRVDIVIRWISCYSVNEMARYSHMNLIQNEGKKQGTNLQDTVVILPSGKHQCSLRFSRLESEANGARRFVK